MTFIIKIAFEGSFTTLRLKHAGNRRVNPEKWGIKFVVNLKVLLTTMLKDDRETYEPPTEKFPRTIMLIKKPTGGQ